MALLLDLTEDQLDVPKHNRRIDVIDLDPDSPTRSYPIPNTVRGIGALLRLEPDEDC